MATIPYMKFYIGDWEQDLNACTLTTEAAWLKVVIKMFKDGESGIYKTTEKRLKILWKCDDNEVKEIIQDLQDGKICEIKLQNKGVEFKNRRMLKAKEISKLRVNAIQNRYKSPTHTPTKDL